MVRRLLLQLLLRPLRQLGLLLLLGPLRLRGPPLRAVWGRGEHKLVDHK